MDKGLVLKCTDHVNALMCDNLKIRKKNPVVYLELLQMLTGKHPPIKRDQKKIYARCEKKNIVPYYNIAIEVKPWEDNGMIAVECKLIKKWI
ncbi:unnamed protein product, partial [Mesorhabditis spiculigera]